MISPSSLFYSSPKQVTAGANHNGNNGIYHPLRKYLSPNPKCDIAYHKRNAFSNGDSRPS